MERSHRLLRHMGLAVQVLLTALAYVLVAQWALWLAAPPAYAAPLYPSAGIALAAVLSLGRLGLLATWLGAFAVNLLLGEPRGLGDWQMILSGALIASGSTAQAGLGAWLVRRRLPEPRDLAEPREALLLFALGGGLACLCSASVAVSTLFLNGSLPAGEVVGTFLSWWLGDGLGVVLGTPVALTLLGQPRHLWVPRRLTVALPMVVLTLAVALATTMVGRSDDLRGQGLFERDASRAADVLTWGLRTPLHALQALHGLYQASDDVTRQEFDEAAEPWLREAPYIAALGFHERLPRAGLDAKAQAISAADDMPWRPFDRADAPVGLTEGDAEVIAMRRVAPMAGNRKALGVNVLSIPQARPAIEAAIASELPSATAAFKLTQSAADETGVVVYQAVVPPGPSAPESRRARTRGVAFVTLRTAEAAHRLLGSAPGYLHWCLVDLEAPADAPRRVLASSDGCSTPGANHLVHRQPVRMGGRVWELRLHASPSDLPVEGRWNIPLFALSGMAFTALLGTLLLTITGRSRRIEQIVADRTSDLRHEIQERRRAEAALRESELRWRTIVDHLPVGVVYADLDGRIREANPRLCRMLGTDADMLCQRTLDQLAIAGAHGGVRALASQLGPQRELVQQRLQLRHAHGHPVEVELVLGLLRDAQGHPRRLLGVVEDITEHLRLAQAERAREAAEAASRAKSEFLSRVSHELRTPLNAILGFGQLLSLDREPGLSERQQGWNEQVQQSGWHLLSLINEMLDLARIESGDLRLTLAPQSAQDSLKECLAMVQPAAQARGLELITRHTEGARPVLADPTRLRQVLTNLLSNAVKYNREGGRVHGRVVDDGGPLIRIEVQDEGEGLSPEQISHLFEPFNRLGREGSAIEGTGLGLVISLRLAEAMGGSLRALSTPGQGACFELCLPAAPHAAAEDLGPPPVEAVAPPPHPPCRVLYIEDNETNAEVMRGVLAQRPWLDLEVAATGAAGLACARRQRPDLLLLDMHLPDMDGLDVLAALRADPTLADVPVLAVSADATAERIGRAQAAGVQGYVTKPIDVSLLLARIEALV